MRTHTDSHAGQHHDNPWHEMRERRARRREACGEHAHQGHGHGHHEHGHHHGRRGRGHRHGRGFGPGFPFQGGNPFQGGFPFAPPAPPAPPAPGAYPGGFPFPTDESRELRAALGGLVQVSEIVASTGGPAAREQARAVIDEARKALYRLLAENGEDEADEPGAPVETV